MLVITKSSNQIDNSINKILKILIYNFIKLKIRKFFIIYLNKKTILCKIKECYKKKRNFIELNIFLFLKINLKLKFLFIFFFF